MLYAQLYDPHNCCLLFNLHHPTCYPCPVLLMYPYCCLSNVILLFLPCYLITIFPSILTGTLVPLFLEFSSAVHDAPHQMLPLHCFFTPWSNCLLSQLLSSSCCHQPPSVHFHGIPRLDFFCKHCFIMGV